MNTAINTMAESLDTYIAQRYEEEKMLYMAHNSIPSTTEEYRVMQEAMMSAAGSSVDLQDRFKELLATDFSSLAVNVENVGNAVKDMASTADIVDLDLPLSISETIDQLNTQLKPAFDSLKSAYEDIFTTDGFTLENVDLSMLESIKSDIDDINESNLDFYIDYSSFEELARVLTDTSSTADDVHSAINSLATEIVSGLTPSLSECSGENYRLIQSLLESVGIMNSEEVMVSSLGYSYAEYIAAKEEPAQAGFDLANATESEINAFVQEQIESGNCGEALALLQLKKHLVNSTTSRIASDWQSEKVKYLLNFDTMKNRCYKKSNVSSECTIL